MLSPFEFSLPLAVNPEFLHAQQGLFDTRTQREQQSETGRQKAGQC
jgi:hypothetical protein